ncbi:hypothetical protein F2P79_001200 [Pimephales promelas]|nr:hypothetical protein F2P79_001200 [Pimephales promelas]
MLQGEILVHRLLSPTVGGAAYQMANQFILLYDIFTSSFRRNSSHSHFMFVDMNWIPAPSGPLFSTKNNRCLSGLRLTPTRPQPGRTIKTNAWRAIQLRESG